MLETAVPQTPLRQGRNPTFQSAVMAAAFSTATGSQTNPVKAWTAGFLQLVGF